LVPPSVDIFIIKQVLNKPADIFSAGQKYPVVFFCYLVVGTIQY